MSLILSGTDGLSDIDGTVSTPAIRGTDSNTGMFFPAADTIAFSEGGVESMRIDSSGNVGIGTNSPTRTLDVVGAASFQDTSAERQLLISNDGTLVRLFSRNRSNNSDVAMGFYTGVTERMRIDSSGKLLVGTTSLTNSNDSGGIFWSSATGSGGEGGFEFRNTSTSANSDANPALVIIKGSTTYTSSQRFIQFNANAGSQAMGGIVGNGATNVQFISLSDAREKENIETITGSLNKITALNPVEFDWKQTGEHINAGFIAQEVESVFPEYVVDNVANAGQEERKGLTGGMSAGFIAHLVKAIQELKAELDSVKAELQTLKGN